MNNTYTKVTDQIITLLENGVVPWSKPWTPTSVPRNPFTPTTYSGVNVFLLYGAMLEKGWDDPRFGTFRQITFAGGKVAKGSKGIPVVYYVPIMGSKDGDDDSDERYVLYRKPKTYYVFNLAAQTDLELQPIHKPTDFVPLELAERIMDGYINNGGPALHHNGGDRAFYRPATDSIHMPKRTDFVNSEAYYSTLFHEGVHSSGHGSRLAREGIVKSDGFGSKVYAREELIAEMGAAMLCGVCGIENHTITNSAAYIQSWLKALKDDRTLVFQAAAEAQRAVDVIVAYAMPESVLPDAPV